MSEFTIGDVVVVTGPAALGRRLTPGEVGDVVNLDPLPGIEPRVVGVRGRDSGLTQYIEESALTPFSEIAEDPNTKWGEPSDPDYVRYQGVHDYVYTEGEE